MRYHDDRPAVTPRNVRRAISRIGVENMEALFAVKRADTLAQSMYERQKKLSYIDAYEETYREILKEHQCVQKKDLAINGRDLIAQGMKTGKEMGEVLQALYEQVLDEPQLNNKETLLALALQLQQTKTGINKTPFPYDENRFKSCGRGFILYYQPEAMLEQYDIEIKQITKGRGVFCCETDQGKKVLAPFRGSAERAKFVREILCSMQEKGYPVEQVSLTKDGQCVVTDESGMRFWLKDLVEGNECQTGQEKDVAAGAQALAGFHCCVSSCITEIRIL